MVPTSRCPDRFPWLFHLLILHVSCMGATHGVSWRRWCVLGQFLLRSFGRVCDVPLHVHHVASRMRSACVVARMGFHAFSNCSFCFVLVVCRRWRVMTTSVRLGGPLLLRITSCECDVAFHFHSWASRGGPHALLPEYVPMIFAIVGFVFF